MLVGFVLKAWPYGAAYASFCIETCVLYVVCRLEWAIRNRWRPLARASSLSRLHHHTQQDSSGRVIIPTQRPLPDNTQQSQESNIHVHGGIRTHIPKKQVVADPTPDTPRPPGSAETFIKYKTLTSIAEYFAMYITCGIVNFKQLRS
jgi:hypothetical protein